MKRRVVFLGLLLATSHAALYYVASSRGRLADGMAGHDAPSGTMALAKLREREGREPSPHARRLDELLASDLSGRDFEAALGELLLEWTKRDLRCVLDLIYQPESSGRYGWTLSMCDGLEDEIRKEMARQPHAVWHWIRSGRYGSSRGSVTDQWSSALIADGQRDLVLACAGEGSEGEKEVLLEKLCRRASAAEMLAIRKLLGGMDLSEPDFNDTDFAGQYAYRRVSLANGDVRQLFAGEEDPNIRSGLCESWVERTVNGLPADQVAGRLAELPEDVRADALELIAQKAPREGMVGVAQLIGNLGHDGLWSGVDGKAEENLIQGLVANTYRGYLDTGEVFQQLGGIADPEQRVMAFRALGEKCAEGSPMEDPLDDLRGLPADANREEFLKGYVMEEEGRENSQKKAMEMMGDRAAAEELVREREQRKREEAERLEEGE